MRGTKGEILKKTDFEPNSLSVSYMGLIPVKEFMDNLLGKTLTVWSNPFSIYSVDKLTSYKFVPAPDTSPGTAIKSQSIVLFGFSDKMKFLARPHTGFGLKIYGEPEKYWVDKFDEREMAIICYDPSHSTHRKEAGEKLVDKSKSTLAKRARAYLQDKYPFLEGTPDNELLIDLLLLEAGF